MIKGSELKKSFEREVAITKRVTPFGRRVRVAYYIQLANAKYNTFICLFAREFGTHNVWIVARSYPMSFKTAHRLVCSL